jgi:hypothetical protein
MKFLNPISGGGSTADCLACIAEDPFLDAVKITWIRDTNERVWQEAWLRA